MLAGAARWGMSPAALVAAVAAAEPDRPAIIDAEGSTSYAELDRRSSSAARGLLGAGVGAGDRVGLLARNSADFLLAQLAAAKLGADVVYLNTGFAAPALAGVCDDERVVAVVCDQEFADLVATAAGHRPVLSLGPGETGLAARGECSAALRLPAFPGAGQHVILTSGTTGRPKGAARGGPGGSAGIAALLALLAGMPLRRGGRTYLAAPMFHAWGFLHTTLGMILSSTFVTDRRFDPARVLDRIVAERIDTLVVVPAMLSRILELPPATLAAADTTSLRLIALSGSALPVRLAERAAEVFGPVLYNLYGSTEVAFISVAGPADAAAAPGSVGRPLPGVAVAILDESARPVATGRPGRIFASTPMAFTGYTGGGDKERVGNLVATGDVGYLDRAGRLWVAGRDDDMIVSGGENVFPGEVEECLREHPAVADVAVVGVADERFGQRLVAHVVLADPAAPLAADELREHVKARLAGYKVPRAVVLHDELPRNETGKVLTRTLRG